jgi:hypothetical protein
MSALEDMVRQMIKETTEDTSSKIDVLSESFQDDWINRCMESAGLVYCVTEGKFIDDEKHNINHIFAHNAKEIREKSIMARMLGEVIERDKSW